MDELTIKQKAEAYDKAIEKLRDFYRDYDTVSLLIDVKEELANIFPEIKESKDERIRQRIINALHGDVLEMSEIKEATDWLERQGEQKPNPYSGTSFEYNGHTWGMCARDNGVDILYDKHIIGHFEKQGATNEKQGATKLLDYDDFTFKPAMEAINEEKVDNANKVEPKFKVGYWITFYGGEPFKILKVEPEQNGILDYLLLRQNGHYSFYNKKYVDENARLWTIADARCGNVLTLSYASKNYILIYKRLYEKGVNAIMSVCCFYCVEENEYYNETDNFHVMNMGEIITPATNEQCALLFQKMKEAGYEWDDKMKEPKKIDSKPSFDAEIPFGAKDSELEEVFYNIPNGFHAEIEDNKVVIKKGEKKPACSNEHYELEEFAKIVRCNLTGISKAVQKLFEAKYLQLTGNKMYGGLKD